MIAADELARFVLSVLLIEATPGPNMAYLATLAIGEGRRPALMAVAGVALGLLIVGLAAAIGLAELLTREPALWQALRWAGVAYLLWLAWEGWREAGESSPARLTHDDARLFRRGVTTNLLNPKAAMFYVAMLPAFVVPDRPALPQTIMLTLVSVGIASAVHLTIVLAAAEAHGFLADQARNRAVRRMLALLLVAVAGWFAATTGRAG